MQIKKLKNNKGFVLAETLVVATIVASIFMIIFLNYYPLIGEYEVRETYDDLDSKYGAYWIKKMIQDGSYPSSRMPSGNSMVEFKCSYITEDAKKTACYEMLRDLEVSCDVASTLNKIELCKMNNDTPAPHIYITSYVINDTVRNAFNSKGDGLKDYVNSLPKYDRAASLNSATYRVIVEYYRHRFDTFLYNTDQDEIIEDTNDYPTYATIEVKK